MIAARLAAEGASVVISGRRAEVREQVATELACLVSDDATYITGCDLNISGGLCI